MLSWIEADAFKRSCASQLNKRAVATIKHPKHFLYLQSCTEVPDFMTEVPAPLSQTRFGPSPACQGTPHYHGSRSTGRPPAAPAILHIGRRAQCFTLGLDVSIRDLASDAVGG